MCGYSTANPFRNVHPGAPPSVGLVAWIGSFVLYLMLALVSESSLAQPQPVMQLPKAMLLSSAPSSVPRIAERFRQFTALSQMAGLSQSYLTKDAGYQTDFQMVAFDERLSKSLLGRIDLHVDQSLANHLYQHPRGFVIHLQLESAQLAVFFIGFSEAEAQSAVAQFRSQYQTASLESRSGIKSVRLFSQFIKSARASEVASAQNGESAKSQSGPHGYAFDSSLQSCPQLGGARQTENSRDEKAPAVVWDRAFQQWSQIKDSILSFETQAREKNKNFTNLPAARKRTLFCQSRERKICEERWEQRQCNDLLKTATPEERKHFFSCEDADDLTEIAREQTAPLLVSCGAGIGGAVVDAALGLILLPQAVWQAFSSHHQAAVTHPDCSSDQNSKLALLGSLRPADMTEVSIDRMSCGEIRKFARAKADTILMKLNERRLAEATRTGNEKLTIYDLKLSESEIQALNYDMNHAGPLRKAQCYRPAEAAKTACELLANSLNTLTTPASLAKLGKKISRPAARTVGSEAGISAPLGPTAKINSTGEAISGLSNSSRARNSIVIGAQNAAEVESFNKAPKWDGSMKIPKNMSAEYSAEVSLDQVRHNMKFETASIQDQSKDLRRLLRDIRKRSKTGLPDPEKEREMGAIIVEYQNGKTQVLKLTSSELTLIRNGDQEKAIAESGILKGFSPVKRIVHVHTHPNPENPKLANSVRTIAPSYGDYINLEKLKNAIEKKRGRKVEVEGIVVPSCRNCEDLLLHYRPEWDTTRPLY